MKSLSFKRLSINCFLENVNRTHNKFIKNTTTVYKVYLLKSTMTYVSKGMGSNPKNYTALEEYSIFFYSLNRLRNSHFSLPCSFERNSVSIVEFVCDKSLSAKLLMTFCRRIQIILTEFLRGNTVKKIWVSKMI